MPRGEQRAALELGVASPCRVPGYPSGEVVAQCWDAGCAKLEEVAMGAATHMGAQQGMVPKWYQAGASASG